MDLSPFGREVYTVGITLDPTATGTWDASFDGGTTWLPGTDLGNGEWGWLVAGPDNTGGSPVWTAAAGQSVASPLLRLVVGQEEIVTHGPAIAIQ